MHKKFNEKSFTFFTVNYIVGFGFISTIASIIQLNVFGIIVLVVSAFITLGVTLVYSRLGNYYRNEYGGAYAYAKRTGFKNFTFFVGWNQYIKGPVVEATAPLFLASAASYLTSDETTIWIIRAVSMLIFIVLILIATMGLKVSQNVIYGASIIKWIILIVSFCLAIYIASYQNYFAISLSGNTNSVTPYLIFSNIIAFNYAFSGVQDVSTMSKDVKFKNFRKILMVAFAFVITFYFVFYLILLGIDSSSFDNFSQIFQIVFGTTGIWFFVIGTFFNGVSARISLTVATTRKVIPLAMDGYLFKFLTKTNSKQEYKNAMWFNAGLTIFCFVLFWLLPQLLNLSSYFMYVIEIGGLIILIHYLVTFITALILEKQKTISKINWFEKITYYLLILMISAIILVYFFPFIVGQAWSIQNTIVIISYPSFILLGFILKWVFQYRTKKQSLKNNSYHLDLNKDKFKNHLMKIQDKKDYLVILNKKVKVDKESENKDKTKLVI